MRFLASSGAFVKDARRESEKLAGWPDCGERVAAIRLTNCVLILGALAIGLMSEFDRWFAMLCVALGPVVMLMTASVMKLYGVKLDENFEVAKEIYVKRIRRLLAAAEWTEDDIDAFVAPERMRATQAPDIAPAGEPRGCQTLSIAKKIE
jgi:hypothetical protein